MLSIVSDGNGVVHVHGDLAGLEALERAIAQLRAIVSDDGCQDSHLFSPAWGGDDLTQTMLENERADGWVQVNHLKLFGWNENWAIRHGLRGPAA